MMSAFFYFQPTLNSLLLGLTHFVPMLQFPSSFSGILKYLLQNAGKPCNKWEHCHEIG